MKRIGILGGLFPNEIRKEIEANSIGPIQYAADALQWALVRGLDEIGVNLSLINLPYIGSYPIRYRQVLIKSFAFSHISGSKDFNVGFINLPFYKIISRYYSAKRYLKGWISSEEEIIVIYAIHTPFILAAIEAKKANPSLKICLVVPDLPEFMGGRETTISKFLKSIEKKILHNALKKIDGFVVLSKFMVEPLQIGNRPWICIEGIYSETDNISIRGKNTLKRSIFYSGTLAAEYGILDLLGAFEDFSNPDYELWICGDGNTKEEIINRSVKDKRIKFYGQLPREKVLILQRDATILVNPRTPEGEFTKYSFPSKTMEYLASGTPTIIHKLPGMPEEYFEHCFVTDSGDLKGLKEMIFYVSDKTDEELSTFGNRARTFILENKTAKQQGEKLISMLKTL